MAKRKPVFTVQTPFQTVQTATLYDNTWDEHILGNHPEMAGQEGAVKAVLQAPTFVCEATKHGYYQFVSHTEVDDRGLPYVVVVSTTDPSGRPAVATAFGGRKKHLDPTNFTVVWP